MSPANLTLAFPLNGRILKTICCYKVIKMSKYNHIISEIGHFPSRHALYTYTAILKWKQGTQNHFAICYRKENFLFRIKARVV